MPVFSMMAGSLGFGRANKTNTVKGGSLSFTGSSTCFLSSAANADWNMGTGNFTIEWWVNLSSSASNSFPRIFSINGPQFMVSLEGSNTSRTFYLWLNGSANSVSSGLNLLNTWNHFAICRNGSTIRVFRNGTQIGSNITNSNNIGDSTNILYLGRPLNILVSTEMMHGLITNFRWIKGEALYTANFTTPTPPLTANANTKLLLLVSSSASLLTDSSGTGKTISNNNNLVTYSSSYPV